MTRSKVLLALFAAIVLGGCAQTKDYSAYRAADPRTILILPPRNSTPEVMATYGFYANTQSPVAESGYYVLPITLVEEHFRTNGMTVADDIHQVPYSRLRDVFGADAALYINVTEYGTKYFIVGSAAVVSAEARLVDLRTGEQLWTGTASASSEEGNNGQGGGAALLLAALIKQVVGTLSDQSYTVSKMTTVRLLSARSPNALLPGPRSPDYKKK
jgi:hypothetical protein